MLLALSSAEKVGIELAGRVDSLTQWAVQRGPGFFLPPDAALLPAFARVSAWVTTQAYEPAAVNTFLAKADYYLVSHALAHDHIVVTRETSQPLAKKIKIPNVCIGLGVTCMTPFEMLRSERARFVLGSTP